MGLVLRIHVLRIHVRGAHSEWWCIRGRGHEGEVGAGRRWHVTPVRRARIRRLICRHCLRRTCQHCMFDTTEQSRRSDEMVESWTCCTRSESLTGSCCARCAAEPKAPSSSREPTMLGSDEPQEAQKQQQQPAVDDRRSVGSRVGGKAKHDVCATYLHQAYAPCRCSASCPSPHWPPFPAAGPRHKATGEDSDQAEDCTSCAEVVGRAFERGGGLVVEGRHWD